MQKLLLFHTKMLSSLEFRWGSVLLGGELQIDIDNSNFDIFESILYVKSGSMPLTGGNWQK